MLIAIDATPLKRASGGIRQYFGRWFSEVLHTHDPDESFVVLVGDEPDAVDEVLPQGWEENAQRMAGTPATGMLFDVLITTTPVLDHSISCRSSVVTIPDVLEAFYPRHFSWRERWARFSLHGESVAGATRLVTMSEFSRTTVAAFYRRDPTAFDIIPPAATPPNPRSQPSRAVANLPERYAIYPGNDWPHKNHIALLEALALIRDRHDIEIHCVLTGARSGGGADIASLIREFDLGDRVDDLGYLPKQEFAEVLSAATLMVFPSRFEGFGIPVLDAFQAGIPVVCSRAGSLAEVTGGAAASFDPTSPEDIATALARVWQDDSRQRDLVEAGYKRAGAFSDVGAGQAFRRCWRLAEREAAGTRPLSTIDRALIRARAARLAVFPQPFRHEAADELG